MFPITATTILHAMVIALAQFEKNYNLYSK